MRHLILLHGATGAADQLIPLKKSLEDRFTVHHLNIPGHGGSPLPPAFTISHFAGFVHDYCLSQGLENVAIFGYSMGGYVAMRLAKDYPGLVARLATLGTKFHWDEATAAKEIRMLNPEVIEQKVPQFAQSLEQRHAPGNWKALLQQTAAMLEGLGKRNELTLEDYAAIGTPALLMLGDRDKMVSLDETLAVYRALPTAQLAILPGTPHPIESVPLPALSFLVKEFLG